MDAYALLFASTLSAGTVLALASLGLLINEKVGIVNLGAEGMMLCAALAGFATVVSTGSTGLGFAAGMAAGAVLAGIFGVLVIWLNTNQYATGLALSLFGAGFSAFAGLNFVQAKMPTLPKYSIPGLSDIPLIGPALFNHHPLVYLAVVLALGLPAARTVLGCSDPLGRLRASPQSVEGIPVVPTYAPSYLLRAPQAKAAAWADLCRAQAMVQRSNT